MGESAEGKGLGRAWGGPGDVGGWDFGGFGGGG